MKGVHSRCETLLQVPIVGVGSTPTCSNPPNQFPSEVTEMHPGNYIYYDTMQQAGRRGALPLGTRQWDSSSGSHVLATS